VAGAAMFVGPVRDYFDVSGERGTPAAVIQSAVSKAQQLKSEASAAGVTQAGEPQLAAANCVALLEHRGVFPRIVADVQEMLADAAGARAGYAAKMNAPSAAEAPAFSVLGLETFYEPPTAAADPDLGFAAGDADATATRLGIAQYPRVRCVLTLSTSQPEPRRFAAETVQKWLQANSKREGVAYTIRIDEPCYVATDAPRDAADAAAPAGGGEADPGLVGATPGGKSPLRITRDDRPFVEEAPPPRPSGTLIGDGPRNPEANKLSADRAAAQDQLEKMAPLTEPPASGPRATGTVVVTWWAALIPAAPADGQGGGK
jgi:hypothetical protein